MVEKKKLKSMADVTAESITPCTIRLLSHKKETVPRQASQLGVEARSHVKVPANSCAHYQRRPRSADNEAQKKYRTSRSDLAPNQDEAEPRARTSHSDWSFLVVHEFPS